MDKSKFGPKSPGRLVRVATEWGQDHAFCPTPLPPALDFPAKLWPLLGEAKKHIGILEGLGRNIPNPAILLRPLADREAIQSSRLEGTYASPKELLLFELDPKETKEVSERSNDHREVYNYRLALNHGTASPLPVSLRLIRELHSKLLSGVRGRDKSPGEFRKIQVGIGHGGRFIPPPPENLSENLSDLERYCHTEASRFDPLVDCFLIHYQFETIHPFIDGNGRVGRLLLAMMLQQKCQLSKPWLYMSEFFEANKDDYVKTLFGVSADGNWESWLELCLLGTIQQAKDTVSRCERLLKIRDEFMSRLSKGGRGSIRLAKIVDDIFHSPFVRVKDLPERLGCTYPTASSDVKRLVAAKILHPLPNTYPKTLYAPEVYNVAYEKLSDDDQ